MRAGLAALLAWGAAGGACRNFGEPVARLAVTPPALTFTGVAGGIAPPRQALTVDAIGGGTLPWVASADVSWISVSPASATAPTAVWVAADIAGLQAGSYVGRITVTTTAGRGMQASVPVTLALGPVVSLSGRWAGGRDTVTISLTISQVDTVLTGSGTLNPPLRAVGLVGSFRNPAVRLTLTAADSSVTTFTGSLVDDNAMLGVLNGGRLSNFQLTIFRQ
jgi:hypothetical protein